MALRLNGSSSGYVELDVPAAAGSHTLTLPDGGGSSGQYLQTNGSGGLSWQTVSSLSNAEDGAGTDFEFNSGYGSVATAYGVRAWIQFAGDGSNIGTGRGSGNMDAVTDNGTGDYTLDFTNNMPDANYAIFAENGRTGTTSYARCTQTIGTPAVGSFRIQVRESSTNSTVDDNNVYVCVVR